MYSGYIPVDPFEMTKHKLSQHAKGLSNAMIGAAISTLILLISVFIVLGIFGLSFTSLKGNPYEVANSDLITKAAAQLITVLVIFLLSAIVLLICGIIILVNYFQIGSSIGQLYHLDPTISSISNVATLISIATIGTIIGGLLPDLVAIATVIIYVLCDILYIIAFYQIFKMFNDLFTQGRFPRKSNILLSIAFGIKLIKDIVSIFTIFSLVGLVIFYIVASIGFRSLASDILLIAQGSTPAPSATQGYVPPQQPYGYGTTYPPQQPVSPQQPIPPQGPVPPQQPAKPVEPVKPTVTTERFCPSCGAKIEGEAKFCPYCGANL